MFELLVGEPPFFTEDINRLYSNIRQGQLKFPDEITLSENCKDIISKLMRNNPKTRLGARLGVEEIKSHPFFTGFNWTDMFERKIPPPISFPKIDEQKPRKMIKLYNPTGDSQQENYYFKNFDYIRDEYKDLYK